MATVEYDECEARVSAWMKRWGLKETTRHVCLHRVAGKKHKNFLECDYEGPDMGTDHQRMFIFEGKPAVFVSEPYQMTHEQTEALMAYAKEHGLYVSITPMSWYNQGQCLHIEVWKRDVYTSRLREVG